MIKKLNQLKFLNLFYIGILLQSIASFYTNRMGPYHRDGSFFLFMANQINKGKPPYWASIDSKNPLVEYFWSFIHSLFNFSTIVTAARFAESLFVSVTIFIAYKLLSNLNCTDKTDTISKILLLIAQFTLSFWKITDNGLNISIYQSLFEVLAIYFSYQLLYNSQINTSIKLTRIGFLIGLSVFLSWFVKQTSLISIFFPICLLIIKSFRNFSIPLKRLRYYIIFLFSPLISLIFLSTFLLNLKINNTFEIYWAGTFEYNAKLSTQGFKSDPTAKIYNFIENSFSTPDKFLFYILTSYLLLLLIGLFLNYYKKHYEKEIFLFNIFLLWCSGSFIQSIGKFTFYSHYFLSMIIPIICTIIILINILIKYRPSHELIRKMTLAGIIILLFILQITQIDTLKSQTNLYPQNYRSKILSQFINKNSIVFNWSGLMHPLVELNIESYYSINMWWWYIFSERWKNRNLDEYMREKFKKKIPEYFIEQYEEYPPQELMLPFKLNANILKKWTNHTYDKILFIPYGNNRYELELSLFKRVD